VLPDLHVALTAIEHGAGISLLPTYMLASPLQANKIKIICEPYKVANDLFFAYKIKNKNMPQIKKLIEFLQTNEDPIRDRNDRH
jgi:DNA-binding transcriptional LysR family regulator